LSHFNADLLDATLDGGCIAFTADDSAVVFGGDDLLAATRSATVVDSKLATDVIGDDGGAGEGGNIA
jgi:hypothetical protein